MRLLKSGILLMLGLFMVAVFAVPTPVAAGELSLGISVRVGPPPIPVYAQPICPGPGFIWTPGYWAFDPDEGYYWVPGTWVMAPSAGMYWTPGYWGWGGSAFFWHAGYWGPHVGFYGGINYGYGYTGVGFEGGEWRGGNFFYNRSVSNVGGHFNNVYYRRVENHYASNRVSYNGGAGGLNVRPGRGELAAEHERHFEATPNQHQHEMAAHGDHSQFANVNHGRPGIAATERPGEFHGAHVEGSPHGGETNGEFHGTHNAPATGYSGGRNPNPPGGENNHVIVSHPESTGPTPHGGTPGGQNPNHHPMFHHESPAPHGSGNPPGETIHNDYHPAPTPHNEVSGGPAVHHENPPHQEQPQEHGPKPSGGGKSDRHTSEPHH